VLIVVCVRARLLARSAASIRPEMTGPVVSAARAARAASLIWCDDLVLTDGHRIQPARDQEQVLGGRTADPDAGQPQDLAGPDPPARGHEVRDGPGHVSGRT